MKKTCARLALSLVIAQGSVAFAGDMATDAEFRMRYQNTTNPTRDGDDVGSSEAFNHRFKLGAAFRSGQKFTGYLGLVHGATWGLNSTDMDEWGTTLGGSDGFFYDENATDNQLIVNEAYGAWMVNDEFMLRFGRGALELGDGTVVAKNDWEQVPVTFEGVLASYDTEFARFSGWVVKFADFGFDTGIEDRDTNSFGLSADFKTLPSFFKKANVHVIQVQQDEFDTTAPAVVTFPDENYMRYGLTFSGDTAGFDYRFTYAALSGDSTNGDVDLSASMMDGEVGYTFAAFKNLRVAAYYHTDTGDDTGTADEDEGYDAFFWDQHKYAGLMDVVSWGNLTNTAVFATFDFTDTMAFGAQYHIFALTEDNGGDDEVGTEIDVWVDKKYDNGFTITGRLGQFAPGDADVVDGDTRTDIFLEAKMTF